MVWGVTGYGSGGLLLTPDNGAAIEAGLSMGMAAAGTRGEIVDGGDGGFRLAFKADAVWVGTGTEGVDGPAGRLAATEAAVTRFRTALEGSRDFVLAGRMSLAPSVEVGLRHDGRDAETGRAWMSARGSSCRMRRPGWRWTCGCVRCWCIRR